MAASKVGCREYALESGNKTFSAWPSSSVGQQQISQHKPIGDYFMNALQGEKSWSYFIDWFTDNITNDDCKYIFEYGILAATPPGLIYYSETVALYKEYWNEIWDIVLEDDITIQDCIREQDLRSATQFANHMVWAATEKLAFERLFNPKKIEYRRTTKW